MQQVAKGGMTQKQMQDAQATIAAISARLSCASRPQKHSKMIMSGNVKLPKRKPSACSGRKTARQSWKQRLKMD